MTAFHEVSAAVVGVEAFEVKIEVQVPNLAGRPPRDPPRAERRTLNGAYFGAVAATIGGKVRERLYSLSNGKQKFQTSCKSRTEITPAIRPEAR